MKNSTRTIFSLLITLFIMALTGASYGQGLKIGYVDDEVITSGYKDWQRAQEQWQVEQKAWEDEAISKDNELQDLISEYEKQQLILSDDKKQEREAAIRAKRDALDAYTRQIYGPGGTAERKQKELLDPLLENITKAIEAVALEDGYDIIFTSRSAIGYIRETLDVSQKVLEQLEKLDQ